MFLKSVKIPPFFFSVSTAERNKKINYSAGWWLGYLGNPMWKLSTVSDKRIRIKVTNINMIRSVVMLTGFRHVNYV